jgi:uncharacterized sulfatase
MLSRAGYYTAHVGKWHLGGQRDVGDAPLITEYGFDASLTNFEGLGERVIPLFESLNGKPFKHPPSDMNAALGGGPIHRVARPGVTTHFVDRAIREIKRASSADKPFFINLWLDDVHSPVQPMEALRKEAMSPADRYLAVLRDMDEELGRLFKYVRDDPRLRDNTLMVLASDNGHEPGLGSAGDLRGAKGQLYEGGIRSPLVVWWPGGMSKDAIGTTNDTTVIAGIDLCPSLVGLTDAKIPEDVKLDGLDLSEVLAGRAKPRRETPVMWVRPPDRPGPRGQLPDLAIRDGDWKLLVERDGSGAELFHVVQDPREQHNRANDHPDKVKKLSVQVMEWDVTTNRQ